MKPERLEALKFLILPIILFSAPDSIPGEEKFGSLCRLRLDTQVTRLSSDHPKRSDLVRITRTGERRGLGLPLEDARLPLMVEQSVLDVNLRGLRTDPPLTSRRSLHAARAWISRCN